MGDAMGHKHTIHFHPTTARAGFVPHRPEPLRVVALNIRQSQSGLFLVSSPNLPGLYSAETEMPAAVELAAEAAALLQSGDTDDAALCVYKPVRRPGGEWTLELQP